MNDHQIGSASAADCLSDRFRALHDNLTVWFGAPAIQSPDHLSCAGSFECSSRAAKDVHVMQHAPTGPWETHHTIGHSQNETDARLAGNPRPRRSRALCLPN